MDETERLAERFEAYRPHLRAVAYRMLGSLSEAEDAVQESWFRLSRSDVNAVENLGGWLTTVVARVCLDMLRSRESRCEDLLGERPPPALHGAHESADPEQEAVLVDSVGPALLVVLDTLSPAERLAFVLHDMFAVPFDDIAPVVGRSTIATRQLASRARRRVQGAEAAPTADRGRQRQIVDAFLAARAAAGSTNCSPCSTRRSWSASTVPPWRWARAAPWVPRRSPRRSRAGPRLPNSRWWTGPRAWSGRRTAA